MIESNNGFLEINKDYDVLKVLPAKLHGEIGLIPSKSVAHRVMICKALALMSDFTGNPEDIGLSEFVSDDIFATGKGLVNIINGLLIGEKSVCDCNESGSTLRFLIPVAAALGADTCFYGAGRLPHRPLSVFVDSLKSKGVNLEFESKEALSLPLHVSGKLQPGIYKMRGDESSQYISGMLMALPLLESDSEIILTTVLESKGYVELTLDVMAEFGVDVQRTSQGFYIKGQQSYKDKVMTVECDYSQAAFWLVANYLGADLKIADLNDKSKQGDKEITNILSEMTKIKEMNCMTERKSECAEILTINASEIPDIIPVICVAAAKTPTKTIITNASRLRIKESDRIASTVAMINGIGGDALETDDGIIIFGKTHLEGGFVSSYNDHRIAMAAAIAGVFTNAGVEILGFASVKKSYPRFFDDLLGVGGVAYGISKR